MYLFQNMPDFIVEYLNICQLVSIFLNVYCFNFHGPFKLFKHNQLNSNKLAFNLVKRYK